FHSRFIRLSFPENGLLLGMPARSGQIRPNRLAYPSRPAVLVSLGACAAGGFRLVRRTSAQDVSAGGIHGTRRVDKALHRVEPGCLAALGRSAAGRTRNSDLLF